MSEFLDNFINNAIVIIGYGCISVLFIIIALMLIICWVEFFILVWKTNRELKEEAPGAPGAPEDPGDPFEEFINTKDKEL